MVDDSNISRAMKDNSKTTVIANLHRAGVKILQEGLERSNILAIAQNQKHSSEKRIGRPDWVLESTKMSHKSVGRKCL